MARHIQHYISTTPSRATRATDISAMVYRPFPWLNGMVWCPDFIGWYASPYPIHFRCILDPRLLYAIFYLQASHALMTHRLVTRSFCFDTWCLLNSEPLYWQRKLGLQPDSHKVTEGWDMVMDKARWQAAPRGVSKRHSLMALRILTPMGREPQKLFISREVHGSTVPFFFFARSRAGHWRPIHPHPGVWWTKYTRPTIQWPGLWIYAWQPNETFFFTLFLSFSLLVPDPKADRSPQAVQDLRS